MSLLCRDELNVFDVHDPIFMDRIFNDAYFSAQIFGMIHFILFLPELLFVLSNINCLLSSLTQIEIFGFVPDLSFFSASFLGSFAQ